MSKVFRFHEGNNNIEDWQSSNAYGKTAINAIKDPAGATSKKQITSIPSPFARMDLIQTAFRVVSESRQLDGNTIYHKMISDCLDIGEILFNSDRFSDRVNIITWDRRQDLDFLINSDNRKHRLLGETLNLYLNQDKTTYNYLDCIYLLNYYKGGPNPINIIGGTSSSTLFFTSANNLEYVDIQFSAHKVFSKDFEPLHKRDFDYQKYIYGLRKFIPDFTSDFKNVDDYLEINFTHLNDRQKQEINNINKTDFDNQYAYQPVGNNEGNTVEVLGFALRKKISNPSNLQGTSDFVIASEKYDKGPKPLVLPNETINEKLTYTTGPWESKNKAPYHDPLPINQRTLPFAGDNYPYLTIDDVLEPYIIRTVYPIQKSKFFDGNYNNDKDTKGYILPIKAAYFDYFDVADLQKPVNGQRTIEISRGVNHAVVVRLRIPIKNNKHILFERVYYPPVSEYQPGEPDIEKNKGAIAENQFGLTLYPFLKLPQGEKNFYRVALLDRDVSPWTQSNKYALNFYESGNNELRQIKAVKARSHKEADRGVSSFYYVLEHSFDFMEINDGNGRKGIIIPMFREYRGTEAFTFAIDFGTTNTHIEYRQGNNDPRPFEIGHEDMQIATLHEPSIEQTDPGLNGSGASELLKTIPLEFMPFTVGKKHEFSIPMRTAISSSKNLEISQSIFALADLNIAFTYEKKTYPNNKTRTNLKWANYTSEDTNGKNELRIIETYFENLLLLMRNKILMNNGDLDQAKLIWFYPSSMLSFRRNMLESMWKQLYEKYITDKNNPVTLSESLAPFYYFNTRLGVGAMDKPVVAIDIGGGTTDIVIYTNNTPHILTSFRFAANSMFGDAFNGSPQINGFVSKYYSRINQLLSDNKQGELLQVLDDIRQTERSEDIIAFFFSIENNKKIREQELPISFQRELTLDNDLKIVFLVFYAAIIYHLAKLMKARNLSPPRFITFSGTGSKAVNIVDPSANLHALSELTKRIFSVAMEAKAEDIELKQFEEPKEITSKGGLMARDGISVNIDDIKAVLLGDQANSLVRKHSYTYKSLGETDLASIASEYKKFLSDLFGINKQFNFTNHFGVNPAHLEKYQNILNEDTMEFIKSGLNEKLRELDGNTDIDLEETLFFYPLTGSLNRLAYKIHTGL